MGSLMPVVAVKRLNDLLSVSGRCKEVSWATECLWSCKKVVCAPECLWSL